MASTYNAGATSNKEPRLTPEEIERFFRFLYMMHDHKGVTPSQPIFWHRGEDKDYN